VTKARLRTNSLLPHVPGSALAAGPAWRPRGAHRRRLHDSGLPRRRRRGALGSGRAEGVIGTPLAATLTGAPLLRARAPGGWLYCHKLLGFHGPEAADDRAVYTCTLQAVHHGKGQAGFGRRDVLTTLPLQGDACLAGMESGSGGIKTRAAAAAARAILAGQGPKVLSGLRVRMGINTGLRGGVWRLQ
jgi:hypothetical protein